jgi:hypothetical protein
VLSASLSSVIRRDDMQMCNAAENTFNKLSLTRQMNRQFYFTMVYQFILI